jgi:hypothetical protein
MLSQVKRSRHVPRRSSRRGGTAPQTGRARERQRISSISRGPRPSAFAVPSASAALTRNGQRRTSVDRRIGLASRARERWCRPEIDLAEGQRALSASDGSIRGLTPHEIKIRGVDHCASGSAGARSPSRLRERGEIPLDLIDQLFVQVEEVAEEVDHEQLVLALVREERGRSLGLVEPRPEVADVLAKRGHALAGDLLAHEVAASPSRLPTPTSSAPTARSVSRRGRRRRCSRCSTA